MPVMPRCRRLATDRAGSFASSTRRKDPAAVLQLDLFAADDAELLAEAAAKGNHRQGRGPAPRAPRPAARGSRPAGARAGSQPGGDVGAFFMALIATCLGIKENPLEYLTALIEWRHKISKENATEWFPHNYKKQLAEVQKEFAENEGLLPYRVCGKRTKSPELQEETSLDWATGREIPQLRLKNHASTTVTHTVN